MSKFSSLAALSVALSVFLSVSSVAQPRRAMIPSDILRVANVTDAQIAPNGQWVVYTVSAIDEDKNVSTLWLARVGAEPFVVTPIQPLQRRTVPYVDWPDTRAVSRPLLPSGWNASTPRWSPDGSSIAFLSQREEQDGLWVVKLDKPDAPRFIAPIQSTNFFITYAGEPFAWSPDSRRIAYISAKGETDSKPNDPRVIDRIQYKSRTSLADNQRTHVWLVV